MEKVTAKEKKRPKRTDPAEFERFLKGARNRGVDESLEQFAAKFRKIVPAKQPKRSSD
jgi:hypothetical protein